MPTSALEVAPTVLRHIAETDPKRILDVGAGAGKYGVLIREYIGRHVHVTAVEAWLPYVTSFRLGGIYDQLWVGDLRQTPQEILDDHDVVLMGDVIEHLPKVDALAFLTRCHRHVVINTPVQFFDNPHDLPWTEQHRSHWTLDDFTGLARTVERHEAVHGALVLRLGPPGT